MKNPCRPPSGKVFSIEVDGHQLTLEKFTRRQARLVAKVLLSNGRVVAFWYDRHRVRADRVLEWRLI